MNQEIKEYLSIDKNNLNVTADPLDSTQELPLFSQPLEVIVERSNSGITLREIIESNKSESTYNKEVYSMICEKTKRCYEVRAKSLPSCWTEGYKVFIVKDQTIYEQLVREKYLEEYLRMLVSSISHEIRNPLNAIAGYVAILIDEGDPEVIRKTHKIIENLVEQIGLILSGACELMASEDLIPFVQPEYFTLKETIDHVIDLTRPTFESKRLTVTVKRNLNTPEVIFSDCKKYSMILFNLLSNAVKYTSEGDVIIELDYSAETNMLTTLVRDTGVGILKERLEKLFELYSNIEHANPYNPQGMGLGLKLCKKLSRYLGGDITVTSVLGIGSKFVFTIKNNIESVDLTERVSNIPDEGEDFAYDSRLFSPNSLGCISPLSRQKPELESASVLIVDDEPASRLVIKSYLKSLSLTCDEAENGKVALALVKNKIKLKYRGNYKLIFMDINMPEMDGTTAIELMIKAYKKHEIIVPNIIAVTASNFQTNSDAQKLLSLGFLDISIFNAMLF